MPYASNLTWLPPEIFPHINRDIYLAVDYPTLPRLNLPGLLFIGVAMEPDAILHSRKLFLKAYTKYDMLLTHDEELLKRCPNARVFLFGTTLIPPSIYETIDISRKQPRISCLTGSKELTPAHTYRKLLYNNQLRIPFPITWFRSSGGTPLPVYGDNPIISEDKSVIFLDFQFSVAIENSRQKYYFTEKLIDCLVTKTIPIYYGCSNIAEYFDTRGWILLETTDIDEFVYKVHNFLPKYEDCMETIEHNYREAMKYKDLALNIHRAINLGA